MRKFRLSAAARRDLEAIQDYGRAEFGVVAVRRHMEGFDRIFRLLRDQPRAGQAKPEYGDHIRVFSQRPHRILYRVEERRVFVVRILHSSQDVSRATGLTR